ncbi:MAG TPA: response regulator [Thermoplasmata archaeon]|nr:MAG TPA: response regulator [Thermoplasmata archaeon]
MKKTKVEILLVEDNPDDAELVMMAIEQNKNIADCNIHYAKDGVEALEYLFDPDDEDSTLVNRPHLIILDLYMPRLDGLEFLKKIREHPEAKNIPIVVLTGSEKRTDWIDSHSLGIDCYIRKSVDFNQFVKATGWALSGAVEEKTFYGHQY